MILFVEWEQFSRVRISSLFIVMSSFHFLVANFCTTLTQKDIMEILCCRCLLFYPKIEWNFDSWKNITIFWLLPKVCHYFAIVSKKLWKYFKIVAQWMLNLFWDVFVPPTNSNNWKTKHTHTYHVHPWIDIYGHDLNQANVWWEDNVASTLW